MQSERETFITKIPEGPSPLVIFSSQWDMLGPFQIGTREASWGADPLESLGGFRKLQCDPKSAYPSSLAPFGQVNWTQCQTRTIYQCPYASEIALGIDFPIVDWQWLQHVYGWAALQYQAWARGKLIIEGNEPQTVLLYSDGILEFWLDDKNYFGGDYYAYRQAPLVLRLCPGAHKVDVRIVRDVRVEGGMSSSLSITLRAERSEGSLVVLEKKMLVSDVVNSRLAGPYAALPARNEGRHMILIEKIQAVGENFSVSILDYSTPLRLAPGQSRSIPLYIDVVNVSNLCLAMEVKYASKETPKTHLTIRFHHLLTISGVHVPHKVTFLHPSRIVSYAILRAPSKNAITTVDPTQSLPVHLNLHGAGVESDSDQVRHMLDQVPDLRAFVIFPNGVTSWSGDDWHDWGFADVRAAVASIANWIQQVEWRGPHADLDRWLVSGHSNGGQGTLYALTHYPDKIIGATPASGYLSIQKYVPYHTWHEAESRVTQMVQNSLQSFRHELLVNNFMGIPVLHQHGSEDDNVPTLHSRRLYQLISESDQINTNRYVELPGRGHWYEGVMTTPPLIEFYNRCLAGEPNKPSLPQSFQLVVSNPADMTSRGGLQVDQLVTPDQLGKIKIFYDALSGSVRCETSNIRRFHFVTESILMKCSTHLLVDGQRFSEFHMVKVEQRRNKDFLYLLLVEGSWTVSEDSDRLQIERHGRQLGPLHAILRTQGHFHIQCLAPGTAGVAIQISRNLYQYFGADSNIVEGASDTTHHLGNLITVSVGTDELPKPFASHPVEIDSQGGIILRKRDGSTRQYAVQDGLGAIFLQPLADERLELVIWGIDDAGLRQAARLFPLLTGVGQPEVIVVSKSMSWKGAAGALALGSFDSHWQLSEASFLQ